MESLPIHILQQIASYLPLTRYSHREIEIWRFMSVSRRFREAGAAALRPYLAEKEVMAGGRMVTGRRFYSHDHER